MNFDLLLFKKIYSFGQQKPAFYKICVKTSQWSAHLFTIVYFATILRLYTNNNPYLLKYISVPLSLLITSVTLRKIIKRERPYKFQDIKNSAAHKNSYCFPSNHCASAAVIGLSTYFINPVIGSFLLLCAFITGISRIVAGIHFPFDVFCGWLLGLIFAYVGFIIL